MMYFAKDSLLLSTTTGNLSHSALSLPVNDDSEDYKKESM